MQNNIPTLNILDHESFVIKSAKICNIFMPFCQKSLKKYRVAGHAWFT